MLQWKGREHRILTWFMPKYQLRHRDHCLGDHCARVAAENLASKRGKEEVDSTHSLPGHIRDDTLSSLAASVRLEDIVGVTGNVNIGGIVRAINGEREVFIRALSTIIAGEEGACGRPTNLERPDGESS